MPPCFFAWQEALLAGAVLVLRAQIALGWLGLLLALSALEVHHLDV